MTTCVIYPPKLRPGDVVRVIAPARSRALVMEHDHSRLIADRFAEMGLSLTFGDHVDEWDAFDSSSIRSRVEDLHVAFADPALQNAILARTGLVTYSGPHWSTFGMRDHFEDTWRWFRQACLSDELFEISPAAAWTDDLWFADQDHRRVEATDGWWTMAAGQTSGRLIGGNLCTLNLLQGTAYMPSLDGAILAVEDDELTNPANFARDLTSLLQQPDATGIRGMIIGRFQRVSELNRRLLEQILRHQPVLEGRPILANVDFGHTSPLATLPIGGQVEVIASDEPRLRVLER